MYSSICHKFTKTILTTVNRILFSCNSLYASGMHQKLVFHAK